MSLFHKHTWILVSADNKTHHEFNFVLNKYVEDYLETIIIEMCTDQKCKRFRTRILSGHHADNIMKNYDRGIDEKS